MKFIELFAGIGAFRLGLENTGHECVWANEWLEKPRKIYARHFGEEPDGRDIRTIPANDLPDADLIVGGFPCATFSSAGKRTGFSLDDTRGTLAFEMFRLARDKRIPYILFENVKGLLNHDAGRTFRIIVSVLDGMGYDCQWELLDSANFGVPQHRERIFLIANLRGKPRPKVFPIGRTGTEDDGENKEKQKGRQGFFSDISPTLDANYQKGGAARPYVADPTDDPAVAQWRRGYFREYKSDGIPTLTANMGLGGHNVPFIKAVLDVSHVNKSPNGRMIKDDGDPMYALTARDRHGVLFGDEKSFGIRKLTPLECERLQGFPETRKTATFDVCIESQKNFADVEIQNLKWQKSVGNVEKTEASGFVSFVEMDSNTRSPQTNELAQRFVRINCAGRKVGLFNAQGESLLPALNAESKDMLLLQEQIEKIAPLLVDISQIAEKIIDGGLAERLKGEIYSALQRNGKKQENLFGNEITQLANDVVIDSTTQQSHTMFTTLSRGDLQSLQLKLQTSFSYVLNAIGGFIPKQILNGSLSTFQIEVTQGWTEFYADGSKVSDNERYERCGRTITIPVVEAIGRKLHEFY